MPVGKPGTGYWSDTGWVEGGNSAKDPSYRQLTQSGSTYGVGGNSNNGGGNVLGASTGGSSSFNGRNDNPYTGTPAPTGTIRQKLPGETAAQYADFIGSSPFLIQDETSGTGYRSPTQTDYNRYASTYISPDQMQQNSLNALIAGTTPNMPVNLPYTAPTVAGLGDLSGTLAGATTKEEELRKYQLYLEKLKSDEEKRKNDEKAPILDWLKNKKSDAEVFDTALAKTGQNQAEYFAQQKAAIDELGALNQQYNDRVAKRDEQIAAAQDILGTTGFISAKQAKIERLAAPELNRMSSNINAKAAVMQAKQGLFGEATKYAQLYVDSQTAQTRDAYNNLKLIEEENPELMKMLDNNLKIVYDLRVDNYKRQLDTETDQATKKITLITDAAKNGVDLSAYGNRSLEDVTNAYAQMVGAIPNTKGETIGSADTGYFNIVRDQSGNIISKTSISGGNGGGSSTPSNFSDVMQAAIDQGATPAEAARAAASVSEQSGIPVDQKTLNAWTAQAQNIKKTAAQPETAVTQAPQSKIDKQIADWKKSGILTNSDMRYALKKQGYSQADIDNSSIGGGIINTLSNWFFKE